MTINCPGKELLRSPSARNTSLQLVRAGTRRIMRRGRTAGQGAVGARTVGATVGENEGEDGANEDDLLPLDVDRQYFAVHPDQKAFNAWAVGEAMKERGSTRRGSYKGAPPVGQHSKTSISSTELRVRSPPLGSSPPLHILIDPVTGSSNKEV